MHQQNTGSNPDLMEVAKSAGFTLAQVRKSEQSYFERLLPSDKNHLIRSIVILRDHDRIAASYWYQNPKVIQHMEAITEYFFYQFSKEMTDLVDEAVIKEGYAEIDVLAFTDPTLLEERIVFARIRNQLYEFHVTEEKEGWVQGLLLELARE